MDQTNPAAPSEVPAAADQKSEPPDTYRMTEVERLQLEVIQLRMEAAQKEVQRLAAQQGVWAAAISAKIGIDVLANYAINFSDGVCRRVRVAPAAPSEPGAKSEPEPQAAS